MKKDGNKRGQAVRKIRLQLMWSPFSFCTICVCKVASMSWQGRTISLIVTGVAVSILGYSETESGGAGSVANGRTRLVQLSVAVV